MEPKRFTFDRTYRADDPYGKIVAQDQVDDMLGSELWDRITGEWLAVRRTPVIHRVFRDLGPSRYIVINAGFETMPIDAREYVFVPPIVERVVEHRQDRRLVFLVLLLALLVVLFAVL